MTLRPRPLAAAAAVLLALAAGGCGGSAPDGAPELGGPLQPNAQEGSTGSLLSMRPGRVFTEALVGVTNTGDRDAVLEAARPLKIVGPVPPLSFYVAGPGRVKDTAGGTTFRFPPEFFNEQAIKPLKGYRLPPASQPAGKEGIVLVVTGTGRRQTENWMLGGYEVTYRVGSDRYRAIFPHGFVGCPKSCRQAPTPELAEYPDVE